MAAPGAASEEMLLDEPPAAASGQAQAASRMAFAAVVLVVLGLGLWALYRFTVGDEHHSFARGAVAPTYVRVTSNETYSIGIRGGVAELARLGQDPATTACEITTRDGHARQLAITPERAETKAINQIASFVSPVRGRVHVDCSGLPAVFVDDADDAATDLSGLWLVLAIVALAVGLPLMASAVRGSPRPGRRDAVTDVAIESGPAVSHAEE